MSAGICRAAVSTINLLQLVLLFAIFNLSYSLLWLLSLSFIFVNYYYCYGSLLLLLFLDHRSRGKIVRVTITPGSPPEQWNRAAECCYIAARVRKCVGIRKAVSRSSPELIIIIIYYYYYCYCCDYYSTVSVNLRKYAVHKGVISPPPYVNLPGILLYHCYVHGLMTV